MTKDITNGVPLVMQYGFSFGEANNGILKAVHQLERMKKKKKHGGKGTERKNRIEWNSHLCISLVLPLFDVGNNFRVLNPLGVIR